MKMLGVSIGNDLSVSQHVQRLVTSSAQATYPLHVLRTRGFDDAARSAARVPCYRRRSSDVPVRRQCVARSHQGVRSPANQLCDRPRSTSRILPSRVVDLPSFNELCDAADDELLSKLSIRFSIHVLHTLLPPPSTASQNYKHRHRRHIQLHTPHT